jgi:NADH-quinone oxidoreductase subunit C
LADETANESPEGSDEPTAAESTAAAAAAPPAPNPVHDQLLERLRAGVGADAVIETADALGGLVVRVASSEWQHVGEVAKGELECDYLSFIAGIDWAPTPREGTEEGGDTSAPVQPTEMTFGAAGSAGRFQVFAHVQSTTKHWGITFKADVDESAPRIASWVPVYAGADWHERECWEMYGIGFDGHPALRHLYLPSEFEGHPLRKDFPLLARLVKPWPGLVDVEPMPGEPAEEAPTETADAEAPA